LADEEGSGGIDGIDDLLEGVFESQDETLIKEKEDKIKKEYESLLSAHKSERVVLEKQEKQEQERIEKEREEENERRRKAREAHERTSRRAYRLRQLKEAIFCFEINWLLAATGVSIAVYLFTRVDYLAVITGVFVSIIVLDRNFMYWLIYFLLNLVILVMRNRA